MGECLYRGPLAILRVTWMGDRELPVGFGKKEEEFLEELKENLMSAQKYATEHTKRSQEHYVHYHNLRSREKSFVVGEKCLILRPDSTASRVFSRWRGPAEIVEVKSPHSYIVELEGARHHLHANHLKKYHVRVDEVTVQTDNIQIMSCDVESSVACNTCAIIYDEDSDFGNIQTIDTTSAQSDNQVDLPSNKIGRSTLSHLKVDQQNELLELLDRYADCFSSTPGLCNVVLHEIPTTSGFVPKRLRAYKIPDGLKTEVNRQIKELLDLGFIQESNSPMASPIVCVMKKRHMPLCGL
jgi:hypothetical protein